MKIHHNKCFFRAIYSLKILLFIIVSPSITTAQERLPWGDAKEPSLITPEEKPLYDPPSRNNPIPQRDTTVGERNYPEYREYRPNQNRPSRQRYEPREYYDQDAYRRPQKYHQDIRPYPKEEDTFSDSEILKTGHEFFGTVSKSLAKVIAHAFSQSGRPNGYILGEEAGGAFVAGLRYGEGTLYTKYLGKHKIYWQGPSIGYDFGAEGSKTMILVYDLRHPGEIYKKFAGVNGSAYLVGGIGLTYQKEGNVVLARIRSGVGVRLGANVGYLKYTRRPTWNPF